MRWQTLAIVSALAAGVTSVFAKVGLEEVPSHLGNAVRTAIVLALSAAILVWSGEHQKAHTLTTRAWIFLTLSAVATSVSWIAYFKALSGVGDTGHRHRQVEPHRHDDAGVPVSG